jgi:hypothetical protein
VELLDAKRSPLEDSPPMIEFKNVFGQAVMFLQVLGAFHGANLTYGDSLADFMNIVTEPFELWKVFRGSPCLDSGFNDAIQKFAMYIVMPVIYAVLILIVALIGNLVRGGSYFSRDAILNVFGEILVEFYVAISLAVLSPFNCYDHPNDKSSMYSMPQILCGEGDHGSLVGLAVLGTLLYVVSTLCITFVAVWFYPKAIQKCDIGMLIRCHFLFHRYRPECYWFCIVAVVRNFLIAFLPMVYPEKDIAVMFMMFALLIPIVLTARLAPRRTPAMNALDYYIGSVQLLLLSVGAMSVYSDGTAVESDAVSIVLIILICTVFLASVLLLIIKGCQWASKNQTPLSWCFDVFLDHHSGAGGSACRVLAIMFQGIVRRNKFFYDTDVFFSGRAEGCLGVIMDAAKLSKHMVVALGNETWCRTWCVGAIASAAQKKIPISVVSFGLSEQDTSQDLVKVISEGSSRRTDANKDFLAILGKQTPKDEIRALGCADDWIPVAIDKVMQAKANVCAMDTLDSFAKFTDGLLKEMSGVPLDASGRSSVSASTSMFFSRSGEKGGDKYTLISSDHGDAEAVAASRCIFMTLNAIKNLQNSPQAQKEMINVHAPMSDVDLDASSFAESVGSGRIAMFLFLVTDRTFKSASQLLRLGYAFQKISDLQPIPVAINEVFRFPDTALLDAIGGGLMNDSQKRTTVGGWESNDAQKFTTASVSPSTVRTAVAFVLQHRMFLCNIPRMSAAAIQLRLKTILLNVASGSEDVPRPEFTEAVMPQPEPVPQPKEVMEDTV